MILPIRQETDSNHVNPDSEENDSKVPLRQVQEWALLELNGELQPPPLAIVQQLDFHSSPSSCVEDSDSPPKLSFPDHVELGSFHYNPNGIPTMIIGSHTLKGKVQKLTKPLIILQCPSKTSCTKRRKIMKNDTADGTKNISSPLTELQGEQSSYTIAGYITKKILFDTYPTIIHR